MRITSQGKHHTHRVRVSAVSSPEYQFSINLEQINALLQKCLELKPRTFSNPIRSSAFVTNAASKIARTWALFTACNGITSVVPAAFSFAASVS
jgi:hypothetical protein